MDHLVIAHQTLGGDRLVQVVRDRHEAGATGFFVVAPLTPPGRYTPNRLPPTGGRGNPEPPTTADVLAIDRAVQDTERRLDILLGRIRALGAAAEGRLGDPDPLVATDAALRAPLEIVEIILATLPATVSRLVGMDQASRIRGRIDLPVTVVEDSEDVPRLDHGLAPRDGA